MSLNHLSELIAAGFMDSSGIALSSGKVYHYYAGTTLLKDMYSDYLGATPVSQPITLDGAGSARVYGAGNYKLIIQNSDGVIIQTIDNYQLGSTVTESTVVSPVVDGQALFSVPPYTRGTKSLRVYFDGVRLNVDSGDYTETSNSSITLATSYAASVKVGSTVLLVEVF